MTKDPRYTKLSEANWRRKLTAAEEAELSAWLAANPNAQGDWEAESRLTEILGRLPDAPLASNFTARVLQTVEREAAARSRALEDQPIGWWRRMRWIPRIAFACVVLGSGFFAHHQIKAHHRAELVRGAATFSEVASVPSPEILQDFDAIRALNPPPPADQQLLTLLQ